MDNKYFKKAGDLTEERPINYFQKAGDLPETKPIDYFQKAGDLTENNVNSFSFEEQKEKYNIEDTSSIQNYLNSISTGKKSSTDFGRFPINAGETFVSLDKLEEMVKAGDNIISAKFFPEMKLVLVKFESFIETNNNLKSR